MAEVAGGGRRWQEDATESCFCAESWMSMDQITQGMGWLGHSGGRKPLPEQRGSYVIQ